MSIQRHDRIKVIAPRTYAETQGNPPFDWNAFLQNPPEFASDEHYAAMKRARWWTTCACGNQCDIIPRFDGTGTKKNLLGETYRPEAGTPKDEILVVLGVQFHADIRKGDWRAAKHTLATIERRSAYLIAQLVTP